MKLLIRLLALTASMGLFAQSDPGGLPRRGWFGVALGTDKSGAVSVTSVTPGSTAAEAAIVTGDVIQAIDDVPMRMPNDVVVTLGRHIGGDKVLLQVARNGQEFQREVILKTFPREVVEGAEIEYGSVVTDRGVRLRTIVSAPTGNRKKLPAVLLLPGGGCGSIDTPFSPTVAQPGLMNLLATKGFVTLRVEKSGVGESKGPPCSEIGYEEELAGYRAGLAALRSHAAVDASRIALVGISLGGVFAPILAPEPGVASVVVWGTLDHPPSPYEGRSDRFFRELDKVDVAGAWSRVRVPVLVLHGEFDEVANAEDHARIAAMVNDRRPGLAVHREFEGLDHCWSRHPTKEAALGKCGQGETTSTFSDAILTFLDEKL